MFYIYIIIIFFCLVAAIFNKVTRQRFLWIYFAFILISEIFVFTKILENSFYDKANCIHVIFLCWYYQKEFFDRKYYKILLMIISVNSLFFFFKPSILNVDTNIFKSFVFILLSIDWFVNQIRKPDETLIYKKMTFWISSSILLWSTIFIIRVIPGHFFAELDIEFLKLINDLYQIVTIFSYLILLKGIFCRQ